MTLIFGDIISGNPGAGDQSCMCIFAGRWLALLLAATSAAASIHPGPPWVCNVVGLS